MKLVKPISLIRIPFPKFCYTRSQSYYNELQRQSCKIYNAMSSLERFENKKVFFSTLKHVLHLLYYNAVVVCTYIVVNLEVVGLALRYFHQNLPKN
jgi:hypothetical protein